MQAPVQLLLQQVELAPGMEWESRNDGWFFGRIHKGYGYCVQPVPEVVVASGELLMAGPQTQVRLRANRLAGTVIQYFVFCPNAMREVLPPEDLQRIDAWAARATANFHHFPAHHPLARQFGQICHPANKQLFAPFHLLRWVAEVFSHAPAAEATAAQDVPSCGVRLGQIICQLPPEEMLDRTPDELARRCGCSLRHLRRLFRSQFGLSLREKQTELRMKKASRLLAETQVKVLHVALESGYRHIGLFNTLFKRHFGMTPSQWRRKHGRSAGA